MSQYFDPSRCSYITPGFPTDHLLKDPTVPPALDPINDCLSLDPPILPPEAPCPDIQGGPGTFRFFLANEGVSRAEVVVTPAEDGCAFNVIPEIEAPCPSFTTSASAYLLPVGMPPEVTFTNEVNSIGPGDPCSFNLGLQIGIPLQACPTISGTGIVNLIAPGETGTITVEAVSTDSDSIDGCNIAFVVTANIPCTNVQFTEGEVTITDNGDDPPSGSITITNLSVEPCAPNFQIDLDLNIPVLPPVVQPTITDLCIDEDGNIQAAEVTYYSWPSGAIDTVLWRTQFGYCDENPCYYTPLQLGLHNTGVDSNNDAILSTSCEDDNYWTQGIGGAPVSVMADAAYPSQWMDAGRKSKWVAFSCAGIEPSGTIQTFATEATIPATVDISEPIALEFWLVMDNWVREIRVNGDVVPVEGLTDVYPGENKCDLTGPMCKFVIISEMVHGVNTIEFDVDSSDIPGGLDSWLGLKLEWIGIGACGTITTTLPPPTTTTTLPPTTTTTSTTTTTTTTVAPTTTTTLPPTTTTTTTTTTTVAPTTTTTTTGDPPPTTPPPTTTTTTTTTSEPTTTTTTTTVDPDLTCCELLDDEADCPDLHIEASVSCIGSRSCTLVNSGCSQFGTSWSGGSGDSYSCFALDCGGVGFIVRVGDPGIEASLVCDGEGFILNLFLAAENHRAECIGIPLTVVSCDPLHLVGEHTACDGVVCGGTASCSGQTITIDITEA